MATNNDAIFSTTEALQHLAAATQANRNTVSNLTAANTLLTASTSKISHTETKIDQLTQILLAMMRQRVNSGKGGSGNSASGSYSATVGAEATTHPYLYPRVAECHTVGHTT